MEKHQEWEFSGKMRTSSIYENWKVRAWGRVETRASIQNSQTIYLGVVEDSRAKSPKLGFRATEWLKSIQATRGSESFNPVHQPPSHLRGLRATSLPCVGSDIWRVMLSLWNTLIRYNLICCQGAESSGMEQQMGCRRSESLCPFSTGSLSEISVKDHRHKTCLFFILFYLSLTKKDQQIICWSTLNMNNMELIETSIKSM